MIDVKQLIQNRYIAPTRRKRTDAVGIEFEFPVIHFKNRPVDLDLMQDLTQAFIQHFEFDRYGRDDNGRIFNAQKNANKDDLSYDCSFNTLELSFGVESDMNILYRRFCDYYDFIESFLLPHEHTLSGMGINPNYQCNENIPIANGRYRMLFHHLSSYPDHPEKFCHDYPNFGMFSCASQVQLDVDQSNLLSALNTFCRLEPLNSLLFANSYFVDHGRRFYCSRDYFWRNSMQGYNLHNLDMYETMLHSTEELVDYIASESIYCLERDGRYINFSPMVLTDYFRSASIRGEYWDGEKYQTIEFEPRPEDIAYHRSYKFEDLTFRGTVEFRSCCEQPASDVMTVAAYFTGLMETLSELQELLENDRVLFQHGYNDFELRQIINTSGLPEYADHNEVRHLLTSVLDLAKTGLHRRGYGEEHFLNPLYERAESLMNPAQKAERLIRDGVSKDDIVRRYASRKAAE